MSIMYEEEEEEVCAAMHIESPMQSLVATYDVHNLKVTPISTRKDVEDVVRGVMNNKQGYARLSFQDNMCSRANGDVLDEIRLLDKADTTLSLVIGNVVVPKALEFVGGVAKLDPPIFLSFLHLQVVRLEDHRQAVWVVGSFRDRPDFDQGTFFYENYNDSVGVFRFGGCFGVTTLQEASKFAKQPNNHTDEHLISNL
jgi:hypothetical protein